MAMIARIQVLSSVLALTLGCTALKPEQIARSGVSTEDPSRESAASQADPAPRRAAPSLPEVRRLSVTPRILDLTRGDAVEIRFALDTDVAVVVDIRAEGGMRVRTLDAPADAAGERSVRWDGRAEDGSPVSTGAYRYRILAKDAIGQADGSEEPIQAAPQEVLAQRFTYDAATRKVGFVLPQPALVRLRMGLRGLPVMRTYYEWEPLEAGRHEVQWDGWDSSRLLEVARHPDVSLGLVAKSIPEDTLLVKQGPANTSDPCAEVCFGLSLPDAMGAEGSTPIVAGDAVTLRIVLDERDRTSLVNVRFEVMVFLDTVYLFEDEDAPAVFNYPLDTSALPAGRHLLTVNLLGYDDRLGSRSLEFIKQASPRAQAK